MHKEKYVFVEHVPLSKSVGRGYKPNRKISYEEYAISLNKQDYKNQNFSFYLIAVIF